MSDREPVLLVVLIETASLSWHVGGIDRDGHPFALLRSQDSNLAGYSGIDADGQVSFLRHRLAGVLQRSCDRLFGRQMKAYRFVFIADGPFPDSADGVTEKLAEHFVQWMVNPPVTYLIAKDDFDLQGDNDFSLVAGELPQQVADAIRSGVAELAACRAQPERWECVLRPQGSDA